MVVVRRAVPAKLCDPLRKRPALEPDLAVYAVANVGDEVRDCGIGRGIADRRDHELLWTIYRVAVRQAS